MRFMLLNTMQSLDIYLFISYVKSEFKKLRREKRLLESVLHASRTIRRRTQNCGDHFTLYIYI